jgi:hypothetical protein
MTHLYPYILINSIKTPDGTVLISTHTHDYQVYRDTKTNKTYGVDGGQEYLRRTGDIQDCEDLSIIVESDDDYELVRSYLKWGSYGKDGKGPKVHIALKDMEEEHIIAILENYTNRLSPQRKYFMELELTYRENEKTKLK